MKSDARPEGALSERSGERTRNQTLGPKGRFQSLAGKELETSSSPSISVIVPVYNAEKTLRQCIDSILAQEYGDFELLLIDDGSKDSSSAMCDEYVEKDSRVKVFHKPNGGVSSARNLGLDHARGEWITFVDSDDLISNSFFSCVVGKNEDLVLKGYKDLYNDEIVSEKWIWEESYSLDVSSFLKSYVGCAIMRGPVCKFYRNSIIGHLRFNENMRVGEDSVFVFNYFSRISTMYIVAEGYYLIRLSEEGLANKYSLETEYAVKSLLYLEESYVQIEKAHNMSRNSFLSYIGYFKYLSKSDWKSHRSSWYNNKDVRSLYAYVWPDLSLKQKIHIMASFILRK